MVSETTMSAPFRPYNFLSWEILEPRGSGLHGQVYLVRHRHTGDHFALKMMHLADAGHASKVRRSLSSATANYRIRHANIVTVHDLGCEEDGRVWVVMEWLRGRSVAEQLALQRGRLSVPMGLHIAIEVCWGVDAAHEQGVIHRDIKPDNVWLTTDGLVKVLDFSLAKVIPEGIATTVQLGVATGLGTVAYLAPEGLRADADVDARIDVYALGLMLWQMIAGRHPYQDVLRNTTELIRRQIYVDPEPISAIAGLPTYVDEFMRRAIAKKRDDRFSTMAEMARALMTLRDRLRADAEQGLVDISVPHGEPPIPSTDPWTRRDYHEPHPLPEHEQPRPGPTGRVVVSIDEAKRARAQRAAHGGTLRLRADMAAPLAGTMPLPAQAPASAPAAPAESPPQTASQPAGAPAQRETSPAVEREPVPRPRGARAPTVLVALVLASAALASAMTWRWRHGSTVPPSTTASLAAPSVSSTVSSPPTSASPEPPTSASIAAELRPDPDGPAPLSSASASAAPSAAPALATSTDSLSRTRVTARPRPAAQRPAVPPAPLHRAPFQVEE